MSTAEELRAAQNTDRELWREREGDFYADSIHVTSDGCIGMNHGGFVRVQKIERWMRAAAELDAHAAQIKWLREALRKHCVHGWYDGETGDGGNYCQACGGKWKHGEPENHTTDCEARTE